MKNIIYRTLILLITILLILIVYLSTVGIKTDKFNSNIISQIKKIDQNLEVKLNSVSAKLNPFKFKISAKTFGTDIIYKDKVIKIESIRSNISLKSFMSSKFVLSEIYISTKTLKIKDIISFYGLFSKDPKFFIVKQFIKNGYIIADLKIEFDELGNIKKNYKLNGLIKDGQVSLFKKYNFNKINFLFEINEKKLRFNDIKLLLNKNNVLLPELIASKKNNAYLISGKLNNQDTKFEKNNLNNFIKKESLNLDIQEIIFSSNNQFKFKIDKSLKVKNLKINSEIDIKKFKLKNPFQLKNIFTKIKQDILFENQKIKLAYEEDDLNIIGQGEVFLQNEIDKINYKIYKKKNEFKFDTTLTILKNPFKLELLNYSKKENSNLLLNFQGKKKFNQKLIFDKISLKEKENIISIKDLVLSNDNKINDIGNVNISYQDEEDLNNNLQITKKNNDYLVSGNYFNINNLIDRLLNSEDDKKLSFFSKDFKLFFDIDKIYLDKNNFVNSFNGFLSFDKNQISELNLESKFSNQRNIKLTIRNNGNEKITTLFSGNAKPLVDRYKFIKGFEEGDLDFYSIKKNGISDSTLKIDNFKVQEIPVLAKILTLASLQGIADLLTGEGIRFTDFEMKFSNKKNLMTIKEMYAIGPAISILMEGYIEKNQLISLRGTLVPATTVNRTISSIPVIGDILIGKKIGEGVFGVSFKIKGPPKKLETTVNPIKTLTPRFITRTLEKIKKN